MIRLAILPGDGIGEEVLSGPVKLLEGLVSAERLEITGPWPVGASAYMSLGDGLPFPTLTACKEADAILFGAVGDHPGFYAQDYRPEQALLYLREYFDLRVSIRQIWRDGKTPLTIVRNLLGGAYGKASTRRESDGSQPASDHVELSPEQIEEVVQIACSYAEADGTRLISVDKANLLATSRLWRQIASAMAQKRGLECRHVYLDQCAFELARHALPDAVIVTEGLFGDILSDLAAARAGSIALCSSASIHPGAPHKGRCVGLFEPVHGTGPDIVGQDVANPTGAYLALIAALAWFPETADLAPVLRQALAQALEAGPVTQDIAVQGNRVAKTSEFAACVNTKFLDLLSDTT